MASQQAIGSLFPSQAVQESSKSQDALRQAQLTQEPGENPLDFSIRQLQAQRDAVAPYSPESAAALNTQLVKLANMKFEQQHLTAQDQREQGLATAEENKANAELPSEQAAGNLAGKTGNMAYVGNTDADGKMHFQAFNINDPDELQQLQDAARKGGIVMSSDRAAQLMGSTDAADLRLKQAL